MIEIDDAGWGCLVGPVLIGAMRTQDGQAAGPLVIEEVPVICFQTPAFAQKSYHPVTAAAVQRLLDRLHPRENEELRVCQGEILAEAVRALQERNYRVTRARIGEPLQSAIEAAFIERLHQIGFAVAPSAAKTYGGLFYEALRWLKGGNVNATRAVPSRARWAKTGWGRYNLWIKHPYQEARQLRQPRRATHPQVAVQLSF